MYRTMASAKMGVTKQTRLSSRHMLLWKSWKCVMLVVDEVAGQRAEAQKDLLRVWNEKDRSASGWTPRSIANEGWDMFDHNDLFVLFAGMLLFCNRLVFVQVWTLFVKISSLKGLALFCYGTWEHLCICNCSILCSFSLSKLLFSINK